MEILNNLETKIKRIFSGKNKKSVTVVFLFGCIGMILICLSEFIPQDKEIHSGVFSDYSAETAELEKALEIRLEDEIAKIEGAGKTSVMITLAESKEFSYAENFIESKDESRAEKECEIVVIEGENGEKPLLFKAEEAKIRGVLVVCEGGGNAVVREKIIEALCALLDIPSNRVSVAKMA